MEGKDSSVRVEIDPAADAAYIRLSDNPVARTTEVSEPVFVDRDDMGVVIGIEVLGLDTPLPLDKIEKEFHVHSDVVAVIYTLLPSIRGSWNFETTPDSTYSVGDSALSMC